MKSIKKHLALFSALLLIAESTTVVCHAATLSIDDVQQAKSNWCWAACCEMVGTWEYGDKDQYDVVAYMFGSNYPNSGANASQTADGATYASNNTTWSSISGKLTASEVRTEINTDNQPFIVGCKYNNSSGGHMLVVKGRNSSGSLYVSDPAYGSSEWVTYSALSNTYGGRSWKDTVYIDD